MHNHNISLQDVARRNKEASIAKSKKMIDRLLQDEVSGLPNVLALKRELQRRDSGSLLLLDINNFNILNKLHGFHFGDMVLRGVAEHIKHTLTKKAKLYKLSCDRFAILKEGFTDSDRSNFSRFLSLRSDYIKIDGIFVKGCDESLEKLGVDYAQGYYFRRPEPK